MGGDLALTVNPDSIIQIISLKESAQALIQVINRGVVVKALILEVGNNMVKEYERLRCLAEKVIDLRDDIITQKAKIKALRNKRRENTLAMAITAGLNTVIIKKKKSLDHPKRLNDGKNPSYKFWQRVIRHKIIINEHKTPTAAE